MHLVHEHAGEQVEDAEIEEEGEEEEDARVDVASFFSSCCLCYLFVCLSFSCFRGR